MEYNTSFQFILVIIFFQFCSPIHCLKTINESLETILHDHAFRALSHRRPHTGALYNASLPANLAGMKVSVVGLRSKTLWRKGANFSDFVIPPKSLPVPYVRRLVIVYHNLGNWSSLYYNVPGYSLVSPVVGFMVYDASRSGSKNFSRLRLDTRGNPISVQFHSSELARRKYRKTQCVTFGANGTVFLSEVKFPHVCYSTAEGHFSIGVPVKTKSKVWLFWTIGFLFGLLGLALVSLLVLVLVRSLTGKRNQEMVKEADEGEILDTYWIGSSKMPRADGTRTNPVLENTTYKKLSWYA